MADNGRIINMETSLVGATTYYLAYAGSKAPLEVELDYLFALYASLYFFHYFL
jgi:hypothetical protein